MQGNNQSFSPPNMANMPGMNQVMGSNSEGREQNEKPAQRVARRAKAMRPIGRKIKNTRQELVDYLAENNVGLVTSALEFQNTGDFILSSYVIYHEYRDLREPLSEFITKYPDIKSSAESIREILFPLQGQMRVKLEAVTGQPTFIHHPQQQFVQQPPQFQQPQNFNNNQQFQQGNFQQGNNTYQQQYSQQSHQVAPGDGYGGVVGYTQQSSGMVSSQPQFAQHPQNIPNQLPQQELNQNSAIQPDPSLQQPQNIPNDDPFNGYSQQI